MLRNFSGKALILAISAVFALSACGSAGQSTAAPQTGTPAAQEESRTEDTGNADSAGAENAVQPDNSAEKESSAQTENTVQAESSARTEAASDKVEQDASAAKLPLVDMAKWQYNADDDVYYQTGISYCEKPADEVYETMGFFVPGGYFIAEDNGDGTFTCEIDPAGRVGNYTADKAPVILPVNTPGYSAMAAPTDYDSSFGYGTVTDYTKEGMVIAFAGCRGRNHGAPLGVTDLKAAVRYIRYNQEILPGAAANIYSVGMSGGGAQSAILGASGDSPLYDPYLEEIGAVSGVSDAVQGSMCWCPITNLDVADWAYEWNLGPSRTGLTEEEQKLSDGMAEAFAARMRASFFSIPSRSPLQPISMNLDWRTGTGRS